MKKNVDFKTEFLFGRGYDQDTKIKNKFYLKNPEKLKIDTKIILGAIINFVCIIPVKV